MDSTPLLHAIDGLPTPNSLRDHPVFLRVTHSPWRFIPQHYLVVLRGIILTYLTAVAFMTVRYKLFIEPNEDVNTAAVLSNWRYVFDFSLISFALVWIYHLTAFSWTYTHLYYPSLDGTGGGLKTWILSLMSLPRNMGSLSKQFAFDIFYTAAIVFAFVGSTIYWFITRQQNAVEPPQPQPSDAPGSGGPSIVWTWGSDTTIPLYEPDIPFSDIFGEGWYAAFIKFNLYGAVSVIMMLEILLLNSIKRPYSIGAHLLSLVMFASLYLGWAGIGRLLTGWYAFDWLDKTKVGGEEEVTAYCVGFVVLAPLMYILMQGFVGIRESLLRSVAEARAMAAAQAALSAERNN